MLEMFCNINVIHYPICEGLVRQPKWGHLKKLHAAIKQCEPSLLSSNPQVLSLGTNQQAHLFKSKKFGCCAFLSNNDPKNSKEVSFKGRFYDLPAWSISILTDCIREKFNTARVHVPSTLVTMNPVNDELLSWRSLNEEIPTATDSDATQFIGSWEQLNITRDQTDYLWYMTTIDITNYNLKGIQKPTLEVNSEGHVLYVYINGQFSGTAYGNATNPKLTFQQNVTLVDGINNISLLSCSMGLANIGFNFEERNIGILGPIKLYGFNGRIIDLSKHIWFYKIGLNGEALKLHSPNVKWPRQTSFIDQPLKWYKATFNAPKGSDPVALDMSSMQKGVVWINGYNIGRYWPANLAKGVCDNKCSYAGMYNENKCDINCGGATQRWYHVPRSWLISKDNCLVMLEEMGGNPENVAFVTRRA